MLTMPGTKYTFNIVNLRKKDSLYNHGMLPLIYSTHAANTSGVGWRRAGSEVRGPTENAA